MVTLWLVTLPRGCLRSPLLWGAGGRAAQEPGIWHDQSTPYRMGKTLCTPYTSNSLLAIYRIIQNLPGCETIGTSTSTRINSRPLWLPVSCTRGGEGLGRRLYWPGLLHHLVVYRRWSRCQSVPVGGEQNMKQTTYSFRKWVKFILRLSVAVMWHGRLSAGEEEPKIKVSKKLTHFSHFFHLSDNLKLGGCFEEVALPPQEQL